MQIAVIADIHGNLPALEAVLHDIDRLGADLIFDLGDRVSGPLWPRETLELMAKRGIPGVRGNHDRLAGGGPRDSLGPSDAYAFDALDDNQRAALQALPFSTRLRPDVLAFHATPAHDERYLLDDIHDGHISRAPLAKILRRLGTETARLILCGHSHRADILRLPDGRWLLNPGSVGCPGYHDGTGQAHVSEAGSPLARYALVRLEGDAPPDVIFRALPYDSAAASRRAAVNDRPDWAAVLHAGFMPSAWGGSGA